MWFRLLLVWVVSVVLLFDSPIVNAQNSDDLQALIRASKTRAELVQRLQKGVVHIKVEKVIRGNGNFPSNNPYDLFNDEFFERFFPGVKPPRGHQEPKEREYKQESLGSGSIITTEGFILTNHHVVGDADKIIVKLYDGRELEAKLVGTDPQSDIAVIRVQEKNLPILPMGNSDDIQVGESVIAIGNPFGLTQTVTFGIVSAKGRSNIGIADYEDFIQTDAAINPGNSGGPLLNLNGEIVGVNTAIFSRSGGYQGIGFAVSVNMARRMMEELIQTGAVSRGWLGVSIQDVTPELSKVFQLEDTKGSLITGVMPDTPAQASGVQKGDVIIELNGKKIRDSNHLRNEVANAKVGTNVKVKLIRRGKTLNVSVALGKRPDKMEEVASVQDEDEQILGITVQELTPELAERLGHDSISGVVVSKIDPDSSAGKAGLRPGMLIQEINQQNVTNVKEFKSLMQSIDPEKGVLLLVQTRGGSRYVFLEPEK